MDETDEPRPRPGSRPPVARRLTRRTLLRRPAEVRKPIAQVPREIEGCTALSEHGGIGDSIKTVTEQLVDITRRPQREFAVGTAHGVRAVEREAMPDRDQHVVQAVPLAAVVVHVARRYDAQSQVSGEVDQRPRQSEIAADIVAL